MTLRGIWNNFLNQSGFSHYYAMEKKRSGNTVISKKYEVLGTILEFNVHPLHPTLAADAYAEKGIDGSLPGVENTIFNADITIRAQDTLLQSGKVFVKGALRGSDGSTVLTYDEAGSLLKKIEDYVRVGMSVERLKTELGFDIVEKPQGLVPNA